MIRIVIVIVESTHLIKYPEEVVGALRPRGEGGICANEGIVPKGSAVYVVEGANLLGG